MELNMLKNIEKDVLTVEETAKVLGVSIKTCYLSLEKGQLPGSRVLKRWIIPKQALEKYLRGEWSK